MARRCGSSVSFRTELAAAVDRCRHGNHTHDERSSFFLNAMGTTCPRHRAFIEWIERGGTLRDSSRRNHAGRTTTPSRPWTLYVTTWRSPPDTSQQGNSGAQGTGGTEYRSFLRVQDERRPINDWTEPLQWLREPDNGVGAAADSDQYRFLHRMRGSHRLTISSGSWRSKVIHPARENTSLESTVRRRSEAHGDAFSKYS